MATILYARVSTVEQTIDHQLAQARAAGFVIDEVVADNGVSGVATRLIERPEGRRLFDKLRAGDTLVVRWVDRLGRNYDDVCDTIRQFMGRGVIVRTVINAMTFDGATTNPIAKAVRDALIAFMAATAQAAGRSDEGRSTGWNRARQGNRRRRLSRPQAVLHPQAAQRRASHARRRHDWHRRQATGLTRQTVYRMHSDPAAAEAALAAWGA
jgi:putative DNA-invertase from lambdoid prophage Rac